MFDTGIVCDVCEKRFGKADDYTVWLQRRVRAFGPPFQLRHDGALALPTFLDVDAALLHLCATTTILRAHISSRWEHASFHAPEVAQEAKAALDARTSTIHTGRDVAMIVTRGNSGALSASPHIKPNGGHPFYLLQMPYLSFMVAASSAGLGGFAHMALRPGREVTLWRRRNSLPIEREQATNLLAQLEDRIDRMFKGR